MPTNDFIGFASSGSANIASQADYAAAAEQGIGMQPGPASSKLANKAWRQGANMAAALGRIAAARGYDALDDGDLNTLQSSIDDTISMGTYTRMYFSQTSGTYTAPRTGVYRITLKGGGGSGATVNSNSTTGGSGGGEGGLVIFYVTLTAGTSYTYTIGAGGAAVSATGTTEEGVVGGASSFTINSSTIVVANGGTGALNTTGVAPGWGGTGVLPPSVDGVAYSGAAGQLLSASASSSYAAGATGGGIGGSRGAVNSDAPNAVMGGGGGGGSRWGSSVYGSGAGGDGFILIEYAG